MATKKVEKPGASRAKSSFRKAKALSSKDPLIGRVKRDVPGSISVKRDGSGSRSIKGADSPKSTASSKGVCPTKPHVPNAKTIKAILEADAGENMTQYDSVEEMLKDLEG
jgi:hypothetical protein